MLIEQQGLPRRQVGDMSLLKAWYLASVLTITMLITLSIEHEIPHRFLTHIQREKAQLAGMHNSKEVDL